MNALKIFIAFMVISVFGGTGTVFSQTGSISGNVSYDGSQTGTVYVAASLSPLSCTTTSTDEPYSYVEISSPSSSYLISGLADGSYYVASLMFTCEDDCSSLSTDPWGIYDGCSSITPVVISGGNAVSGKDIILVDGTTENPNPFYYEENYYYLNVTGNASVLSHN